MSNGKKYDESEATWEPADNVEVGAGEAIENFEAEQLEAEGPAAEQQQAPAAAAAPVLAEVHDAALEVASLPVAAAAEAIAVPGSAPEAAPATSSSRWRSPRNHASSASVDAGQQHVQMAMSVISSSLPGGDYRLNETDSEMVCAVASGLAQLEDKTPDTFKEAMESPEAKLWRAATDK